MFLGFPGSQISKIWPGPSLGRAGLGPWAGLALGSRVGPRGPGRPSVAGWALGQVLGWVLGFGPWERAAPGPKLLGYAG